MNLFYKQFSKSDSNFYQDTDCKLGQKYQQNFNKNTLIKAKQLVKVNVSKNYKMIEKLNSGICTLGELINICLQPSNYETDYINKSERLIQTDKYTSTQKRRKSEEEVYSLLEAHLNEDISRKRAKTKFNQNEEQDNNNLIEQILSSTIDYSLKSNQIIINTKNSQKERIAIKVKVFNSKDEGQQNDLDESTYIVSQSSNLVIIVEFAKQISFGQIKPDFEDTKTEIEDYKRRILSSLSHELKTPLNCSIQLLDILLQNERIDEALKQMFVEPALNSNQLLLCMINDILDLAQIEKREMRLQFNTFSIIDLLRECVSYFMFQAASKKVEIELNFDKSIPYIIHTDEMRLKQVVINLLGNAIKFTSRGMISLYVDNLISASSPTDTNSNEVIKISISDTGCGIEPQNLRAIFEGLEYNDQINNGSVSSNDAFQKKLPKMQSKFYNQKKLNTEGAGLGLTIANKIARGLGGNRKIEVQSQLGVGSSFSFFVVNRSTKSKGVEINNYKFLNKSYFQWKSFQSNTITKEMTEYVTHTINDCNVEQSIKFEGSHQPNKPSLTLKTKDDVFFQNNISIQDINLLEEKVNRDPNLNSPSKSSKIKYQLQQLQFPNNSKTYSNRLIENNSNLNQSQNQEDSCDIRSDFNSSNNIPVPNNPINPFLIQTPNNNGRASSYFSNSPNHQYRESICLPEPCSSQFDAFPKKRLSSSNQHIRIIKDQETEILQNNFVQFLKQARLSKVMTKSHSRLSNFHQADTTSSVEIAFSPQIGNSNTHLQNVESISSQNHIKKHKQSNFQQQTSSLRQINNGSNRRISILSQTAKNDDYEKINNLKNDINIHQQKPSSKSIKTLLIERNQKQICSCSHILIVDDNNFNLLALEFKLKVYNFIVEKAESGFKALSMISSKYENSSCCQKYGLIFMDIDMPDMNGYQTTQEIRQYYLQKNTTPTIISACTAFVQESEQRNAKQAGMKYYIMKPILTEKIEEVLFKVFLQKQQIHKK